MAKETPEVKEIPKIDPDLGISLDFGSEQTDDNPIVENTTDDLLESSLKDNIDDPSNSKEDNSSEELDISKELDSLINNETDDPATADETKKESKQNATEKKEAPTGDEETSGSLTIAYAKILQEQGLSDFNEEDYKKAIEEKGEAAAFMELLDKNADTVIQNKLSQVDDFTKEYTKLRQTGFTQEEAGIMVGNLETVSSITPEQIAEDEQLQEQIIREVSNLQGKSQEEIDEDIQLLKDTDKLKSRSERNLVALQNYYKKVADQEYQNKQQAIVDRQKADQEYLNSLKENVYGVNEILKDKRINKQTQDKLFDMITKPVKELDNGQKLNAVWAKREENRQDFDIKLAYFINLGLFDGKIDKLAVDARTKATDNLKKIIEGNRNFSSGAPVLNNEDRSIKDKAEEMNSFLDIE